MARNGFKILDSDMHVFEPRSFRKEDGLLPIVATEHHGGFVERYPNSW